MTDYESLPGIRWSTLKHMARSPLHYQYALANDTQPRTDAMILGTVTHLMVFEPERVAERVAVWSGRRAGTAWEEFELQNRDKEIIKEDAMALAWQIAEQARKAAGKGLAEGESEVAIQWTHRNGLPGKGRLDHVSRGFGIWDLKTTRDASPDGFGRSAASLSYLGQSAYYVLGYEAMTGVRLPYTIIAVESKPPFAAALYTVTDEQIELGRVTFERLLDRVKECQASGVWPSYSAGVLSLPRWATSGSTEGLDGLGLTMDGEDL